MLILPDMSCYDSQFPSTLDWEDFQDNVEYFTDSGTLGCCGAVAFRTTVSKLISRGKAFLISQRRVSQLQYEIMVNRLNADVVEKQKKRLDELGIPL